MHTLTRLLPHALRCRLLLSHARRQPLDIDGVEVRVATSTDELRAAARLVHDSYVDLNLLSPHSSRLRVTPHSVAPSTVTFVAIENGAVIGTSALVGDSPLGLPLERVYGREVASLRLARLRLGEFGALAVAKERRGSGVVNLLYRIMWNAADRIGMDRCLAAIHPKAENLYRETMLFERLGPEQTYPGLNRSARAIAVSMDITRFRDRVRAFAHLPAVPGLPHFLCSDDGVPQVRLPPAAIGSPAASAQRAQMAGPLVRARIDVFRALPASQLSYLREVIPDVLWPSRSQIDRHELCAWDRAACAPTPA